MLTPDELLAGGALEFEIEVPDSVVSPVAPNGAADSPDARKVKLRPLTVHDLQLISRAAKERDDLVATLMVQRALVEPEMSIAQVASMHVGLVQFLLEEVNQISGITANRDQLSAVTDDPLAKAAFLLSREFGWTPQQISELTMGQVLTHLQMLDERVRD